jgi:hypothetical protein
LRFGSTGAPVTAFVRADLKPIRPRCQVERPDALIILDDPGTPTGLKPEGWDYGPDNFEFRNSNFEIDGDGVG